MLLEAFLDYLRLERNVSPRTLKAYRDDLIAFESFFEALEGDLTWQTVDTDVAREWVVSMMEKGNKAASIQRRLSALRSCYRFLYKRGLVEHDPVHSLTAPKKERTLPAFVREQDMDRLLDTPGMFEESFEGRRDRLIIAIFYEAGLRLSELVGLDMQSMNLAAQTLKVFGKGRKERIVPFGVELLHLINIYIGERALYVRDGDDREAFFLTAKGTRMTTGAVRDMVKGKLGLVTSQQKRSPHVLRHTFATTMLNHEADLESVKELLGHSRLQTTEIYTHTTFEELKKVYSEAHPRA